MVLLSLCILHVIRVIRPPASHPLPAPHDPHRSPGHSSRPAAAMPIIRTHWSMLPSLHCAPDGVIWRLRSFKWSRHGLDLEWCVDSNPGQLTQPHLHLWHTNVCPFGLAGPPSPGGPPVFSPRPATSPAETEAARTWGTARPRSPPMAAAPATTAPDSPPADEPSADEAPPPARRRRVGGRR